MLEQNKQFIFYHSDNIFSLPLENVAEVTENLHFNSVQNLGKGIIGVVNYLSNALPVVNPSFLIADNNKIPNDSIPELNQSYVVIELEDWKFAFLLDKFHKIIPKFQTSQDLNSHDSLFSGIGLLDNRPVYIIHLQNLIFNARQTISGTIQSDQGSESSSMLVNADKVSEKTDSETLDSPETDPKISKCLCFFLDSMQFGIPIQDVVEVVDNLLVTPLFKVSPYLRGLINVRGKVIPCVDISAHLKLPYRPLNENTKFVILRNDSEELAICVDSISNMRDLSSHRIQKNDGLLEKKLENIASGIVHIQNETVLIVSSQAIIGSNDLKEYRREPEL